MADSTEIQPLSQRWRSERGVSLIMVAIALLMLTGFLAFVLDYGVMWLARRQAQNAADAGALAGAVARAFDETTNPPSAGGLAFQSAVAAAQSNDIIGEDGGVRVTWECPAFAAGGRCVRVDVHRDGTDVTGDGTTDSTRLPVFVAAIFGETGQNVRATATAWVQFANATNCMRPFAVADKWTDNVVSNPLRFDRWKKQGNVVTELNPKDTYVPTSVSSTGTGYTVEDDLGAQVFLKRGNPSTTADDVQPGWSLPVRLPDGAGGYVSGANDFNQAIKHCIGNPVAIGDYLPLENGVMQGPTEQGVSDSNQGDDDSLMNQDPNAEWDDDAQTVTGTCAPGCAPFSPRIVPIAVFDMDEFQWRKAQGDWTTQWIPGVGPGAAGTTDVCPGGGGCIRVVNIIGFFVEDFNSDNDVVGRVVMYPGEFVVGPPNVNAGAGFLVSIQLIR
jgi:hypothetical protein